MISSYNQDALHLVATGAAVLGSGGGGSFEVGKKLINSGFSNPVEVLAVEELDVNKKLCVPAAMGPESSVFTNPHLSNPAANAVEALQGMTGDAYDYLMPFETGAINTIIPLVIASQQGQQLVDGDGLGRAVPTIPLAMYSVKDYPVNPNTIASDAMGQSGTMQYNFGYASVNVPDNEAMETAFGGLITSNVFGGVVGIALYPVDGDFVQKNPPVLGTVSRAHQVGTIYRDGASHPTQQAKAEAIMAYYRQQTGQEARIIFQGTVSDIESTTGVTDNGQFVLTGTGDYESHTLKIATANENIFATLDDDSTPIIMGPDSINVIASDNCSYKEPFDNTDLQHLYYSPQMEGPLDVIVMGFQAVPEIRTQALIEKWKPIWEMLGYYGEFSDRWLQGN